MSGALWGSALQTRVSKDEIGRASSFDYAASFGLIPLGYAVFGLLSGGATAGVLIALVGLSLMCAGVGGGFMAQQIDRTAAIREAASSALVQAGDDKAEE
ncbi:hypothetical protein [Actinomyces trachealis]|uniref:hypothetical protein n=1 Tax=Actinomyces trachealis TaxID=2763540 RepID=UPI0018C6036C|nr:hypothetical protein [Actinomyces trachealis]